MPLPQSDLLVCSHLGESPEDETAIREFAVSHPETGQGLENYLKQYAWQDEVSHLMRTYLVRHRITNECVGYFSLKAGLISIHEQRMAEEAVAFDTLPGVELANFAINQRFQEQLGQTGLGGVIFRKLIAPFVLQLGERLGIFMLYLFALPYDRLIKTYARYGFQRLPPQAETELHKRLKPTYDASCIFMFQTLEQLQVGLPSASKSGKFTADARNNQD